MAPMTGASLSIVRCSSQDPVHRAENILTKGKKWLSNKDEKSGKIEVEIHLSQAVKIGYINIGNAGSAFLELLVGSSMWSSGKDYVTLLPSTMLMSPADSKIGQKNEGMKMLDKVDFANGIQEECWDRLRVICHQPYSKNKQFGLQFVDIIPADDNCISGETESQRSDRSPRPSLAEFQSKLHSSRTYPEPPSPIIGHFTSPISSRAAGLVEAALKGRGKPKQIMHGKSHQKRASIPARTQTSPYPVDAQLQRRKSHSRRDAGDIEDEVECFLETFNFEEMPLESVTYKHLKEQMEEMHGCELTKQERKIFLRMAKKAVSDILEKRNSDTELEESISENTSSSPHESLSPPSQSLASAPFLIAVTSRSRALLPQSSPPPPLTLQSRAIAHQSRAIAHQSPEPIPESLSQSPQSRALHSQSRATVAQPVTEALEECPICEKFFPRATIEIHASTCVSPRVSTSPTRDSDVKIHSPVKPVNGDVLGSTSVRCPICSNWFPSYLISVHANVCVEASLMIIS